MERTTSDSDPNQTAETNSKALNTAAPSWSPAFSPLLCFAGNSAFGAIVGSIFGYGKGLIKKKGFKGSFVEARSSAKRFSVSYGVDNSVLYQLNMLRGKDDVINAGVAGCCTGLALSFPGSLHHHKSLPWISEVACSIARFLPLNPLAIQMSLENR